MSTASKETGFSLLEVVVALAIAAIATPIAVSSFRTAFEGTDRAERKVLALLAAESKLAELAAPSRLRPGRASGETDSGFRWAARITPYRGLPPEVLEAAPVAAYEIEVTVDWKERPGDGVRLRTLRLAPRGRDG